MLLWISGRQRSMTMCMPFHWLLS